MSNLSTPQVFDYLDYRKYLADWQQWKKNTSPQYSGAMFARKAGLNSHSLLGMVIRGDRNLSYSTIRSFSRALDLKGKGQLYFEKLVLFNQSRDPQDKSYHFEQLATLSDGKGRSILTRMRDYAEIFSHWYVVATRELANLPDFSDDPDWVVQKLKKKITRKQAVSALETLFRVGLLVKDSSTGKVSIQHPSIDIDPGAVNFVMQNFHKEYLDRAVEAIRTEAYEDRELSSLTMSVSDHDFERLRQKVKEFRKQMNLEFPVSNSPSTRVVAINTQVLVLSEKMQGERDETKQG